MQITFSTQASVLLQRLTTILFMIKLTSTILITAQHIDETIFSLYEDNFNIQLC